jgi:hypothetical protein
MALNIPALTARGAAIAKRTTASVQTSVLLKSGPTNAYTPGTDANVATWAREETINGFLYAVKLEEIDGTSTEEINAVITGRAKKLIIWDSDVAAAPDERSVVVIGSETWQVKGVEAPPSEPIYILQLRR